MPSVIGWSLVLIFLLLAGFFVVARLRSWLKSDDEPVGIGFSLSDLKQLHREGKLSDEELERARTKILGAAKEMSSKLPDPLAGSNRARRQEPPADPR